tara:strand:- start:102 stop:281 length:180 start_codon:yes stop_codon:yes gene_type:complete
MKYKAKETYKQLSDEENFMSLGMASKHTWLIEGSVIEFNGDLSDKIKGCLTIIKEKGVK